MCIINFQIQLDSNSIWLDSMIVVGNLIAVFIYLKVLNCILKHGKDLEYLLMNGDFLSLVRRIFFFFSSFSSYFPDLNSNLLLFKGDNFPQNLNEIFWIFSSFFFFSILFGGSLLFLCIFNMEKLNMDVMMKYGLFMEIINFWLFVERLLNVSRVHEIVLSFEV